MVRLANDDGSWTAVHHSMGLHTVRLKAADPKPPLSRTNTSYGWHTNRNSLTLLKLVQVAECSMRQQTMLKAKKLLALLMDNTGSHKGLAWK